MAYGPLPSGSMMVSMISPSLGGELPEFVKEPEEKYFCLKCTNILRPPVQQSPCGHRFCSECCQKMFAEVDGPVPCPGNEEDCEELTANSMHFDNATKRELLRLDVYCNNRNQGCTAIVKWGKLPSHLQECLYKTIICPNGKCGKIIAIKDLQDHDKICEYVLTLCTTCNSMVTRKDMREGHERECATKPHPCPMEPLGCDFKGTKPKIKEHALLKISSHNSKVVNALQSLKVNHSDLGAKANKIDETIKQLEQNVNTIHISSEANKNMKALELSTNQLQTEFNDLKNDINSYAKASDLVGLQETLTGIQETATRVDLRINTLEQGESSTGAQADVIGKIQRMESTVGMHDIRIAESDLRFRLLETAAFDGRLIWRIPDYTRRKQEAADGRTMSLYSQPFYSGYYGYKMCARVYLNGDGLGKGTHLSLFFVMMKGEYDALQNWPFRQRVTLSLLDQSGSRKHVTDQFRPDPTSSSFRRPVGEMNIASGSPMFAPLTKVESAPYLKDNTLFICISIDKTDLPDVFP